MADPRNFQSLFRHPLSLRASNGFFPAPALEADVIPFHPRHAYVIVEAGYPVGPKVINLVGKKGGEGGQRPGRP